MLCCQGQFNSPNTLRDQRDSKVVSSLPFWWIQEKFQNIWKNGREDKFFSPKFFLNIIFFSLLMLLRGINSQWLTQEVSGRLQVATGTWDQVTQQTTASAYEAEGPGKALNKERGGWGRSGEEKEGRVRGELVEDHQIKKAHVEDTLYLEPSSTHSMYVTWSFTSSSSLTTCGFLRFPHPKQPHAEPAWGSACLAPYSASLQ